MSHVAPQNVSPSEVEAYIRLSREDLREPGSLEQKFENRRDICRRKAREFNLPLLEENIHCERASGTSLTGRPLMAALLQRARERKLKYLVTPYPDRITRGSDHDRGTIKKAFLAGCVTVISTEGVMEFNREFGIRDELTYDLKAAVGAHVVRDLVHKRMEADFEKLKKGTRPHTSAGYGFHRVSKRDVLEGVYAPDQLGKYHKIETEYAILLEIILKLQNGVSVPRLVADLNARNIPTPSTQRAGRTGTRWYASTIYGIMRNPFYIGHLSQRKRVEDGDAGKHTVRLKVEEYVLSDVKGEWEQAMDEDTFHQFAASIRTIPQRAAPRTGLLTGLLFCPQGTPMRVINQGAYGCDCKERGQPHRGCSIGLPRVHQWLQGIVGLLVNALPPEYQHSAAKPKSDRTRVLTELAGARRDLAEKQQQAQDLLLREVYFVGLMGRDTYEDTARHTANALAGLKARVEELQQLAALPDIAEIVSLAAQLQRFGLDAFWQAAPPNAQRAVVEGFVQRVDVVLPESRFVKEARVTLHDWAQTFVPKLPPLPGHPGRPENLYLFQKQRQPKT